MARLFFRLVVESLLAGVFITAGILVLTFGHALPAVLGWAGVVIGALIFVHVVLAAAFGKVRTPDDLGVGFVVPKGSTARRTRVGGERDA